MPAKSSAVFRENNSRTAGIANDARTSGCVSSTPARSLKMEMPQYPATNNIAAIARHAQRPAGDFARWSA